MKCNQGRESNKTRKTVAILNQMPFYSSKENRKFQFHFVFIKIGLSKNAKFSGIPGILGNVLQNMGKQFLKSSKFSFNSHSIRPSNAAEKKETVF